MGDISEAHVTLHLNYTARIDTPGAIKVIKILGSQGTIVGRLLDHVRCKIIIGLWSALLLFAN